MHYLPLSFFAGILTILAPCVLPVLPLIIGGSLSDKNPWRPVIITLSLAGSIVLFTLLLKASTIFITIPNSFWQWFSASIVLFFAGTLLLPSLWEKISAKFSLGSSSQQLLNQSGKTQGVFGMILIGAALGPVFASCSPTYFLIVGTVLPQQFVVGLLNLVVYALGLALPLAGVALAGQRFIGRVRGLADPKGPFKKILGIIFVLLGLAIAFGYDKKFEALVLEYTGTGLLEFEQSLVEGVGE